MLNEKRIKEIQEFKNNFEEKLKLANKLYQNRSQKELSSKSQNKYKFGPPTFSFKKKVRNK